MANLTSAFAPPRVVSVGLTSHRNGRLQRATLAAPTRGGVALAARSRRSACQVVALGEVTVGTVEKLEDGGSKIEYSFDLGGDKAATQNFEFSAEVEPLAFTIPRPLGIVFEERRVDGKYSYIRAEEVMEDSNADKAGVKVGDVLKCTTAVFTVKGNVNVSTWLNPPKDTNVLAYFPTEGKKFEDVMNAILSNGQLIDTPRGKVEVEQVSLVLERKKA